MSRVRALFLIGMLGGNVGYGVDTFHCVRQALKMT